MGLGGGPLILPLHRPWLLGVRSFYVIGQQSVSLNRLNSRSRVQ